MTKFSRSGSSALLIIAPAIALAAGLGLGAAGCAVQSDEPASAGPAVAEPSAPRVEESSLATPAAFQVVWACFDPGGNRIGLPKSTLAFCQAACPAGDSCVRCVWQDNALECP
jgi:hypothetical protein